VWAVENEDVKMKDFAGGHPRIGESNNRKECHPTVPEQSVMEPRYSSWWTSLSASVTCFVGQRLSALGKIIAHDLERSYAGRPDNGNPGGRKLAKTTERAALLGSDGGADLSENQGGDRRLVQ
jgi:hypothetical protein